MTEIQKIHSAMVAVMRDVDFIGKDRKADGGGPSYKFRGIDDIYNTLHPLLAKHGIFMMARYEDRTVVERSSRSGSAVFYVTLTGFFRFTADDGSFVECSAIGEAMDNSDKATNKAMSVALKYAVMQTFFIPTEEPKDPENDHIEVAPKPVASDIAKKMIDMLKGSGFDTAQKVVSLYREVLGKDKPTTDADRQKVIAHLSGDFFEQARAEDGGA